MNQIKTIRLFFIFFILTLLSLLLISCGPAQVLNKNCSKTDPMCVFIFGEDEAQQSEDIEDLRQAIALLQQSINILQANSAQNTEQEQAVQAQINEMKVKLAELEAREAIIEYMDPCGDYPGYFDEIIMRTSSGKYIAYFEQSGKRFLTLLKSGTYKTTDKQGCVFSL